VTWTCVGDEQGLLDLLSYIPALGRLTTHGHGWISRWEISDGGPPLEDYARDVTLRHLPTALVGDDDRTRLRRSLRRARLPVRPPYSAKENAQDVIQHWTDDES
jgi:CRISPR type IV-associated protein Csf3